MTTSSCELEAAYVAATAAQPRARRTSRVLRALVPPVVGVGGFLLVWQLLVTVLDIPQFELPAPSAILRPTQSTASITSTLGWAPGSNFAPSIP